MKQPCYNCPDRTLGCHGQCERYAEYRTECDRIKAIRKVESDTNDAILEARRRRTGPYKWNKGR